MDTNGNGYAVGTGNSNGPVGTVFKASAADDFATWTDISPAGISSCFIIPCGPFSLSYYDLLLLSGSSGFNAITTMASASGRVIIVGTKGE